MPVTAKDVKAFESRIRALQQSANALSNDVRVKVMKRIEQSRLQVKDLITSYPKDVTKLPAGDVPRLSAQIQAQANAALNDSIALINEAQRGAYEAGLAAGAETAAALGIAGVSFGPNTDLIAVAMNYTADLVRSIPSDLMPKVNGELSRAALGGKSPFEAMQAIDSLIGKAGTEGVSYQAERIVRTEVQRIYSITLDAQMQQFVSMVPDAGQVVKKKWVSGGNRPGRRWWHQEMDGEIVPFNEPFSNGLMYPHDPAGPPEETINCGCQWVTVVDSMEDLVRDTIMNL